MTTDTQTTALLSPVQAAEHLGFALRTLKRWRKKGTGPAFVRAGNRVRYRKEALDAWIAAREVSPA